jgi:hypothetical protein
MNYAEARTSVNNGGKARRTSWKESRQIRKSTEADRDFIDFPDLDKVLIDECPKRNCDCVVCIYQPIPEDMMADDWELVK